MSKASNFTFALAKTSLHKPKKNRLLFDKYLPFSKYITYHDTFTFNVQSVICLVWTKTERDNFFTKCLSPNRPFNIIILSFKTLFGLAGGGRRRRSCIACTATALGTAAALGAAARIAAAFGTARIAA